MLIKTRGIIFRSVKYSETSIISDIYTEEKGLRTYIISGVRTKRSRVSASLLQVMTLVNIVAYHREDKDINRIKEIRAAHIFNSIPFKISKGAIGMFMIELARKSIREQEVNKGLFEFLFKTFQYLDNTENSVSNLHLSFMLHLCSYIGFLPGGKFTEAAPFFEMKEGVFTNIEPTHRFFLKEPLSVLLSDLLHQPLMESHLIKIDRNIRNELLSELIKYYRLHIENLKEIHAHEILKEVLG